ncbi:hypothetical protein O181_122487 [Austropuccinia psidii MF-1]|uniref:Reverse transcriptase Ty1/copia-type domain-containing protein n=1 Tax=Austropuccinia psidii MF-1 TaxID=1389203 RepID=A0A9Q3Q4G4_9BASI|nr:hypothetical protein [Austropuccinia psidii MF-1]
MVHYFHTYSSVARNESLKILLSLAINRDYHVFQFDVETAFLYGEIDAPIYVSQVTNFKVPGKKDWVWMLNKSLYGTKQAPRQWRAHLVDSFKQLGLSACDSDESLFFDRDKDLFIHIHVDDGLIVGSSKEKIQSILLGLQKTYKLKTQEKPKQHLGYTFSWLKDGLILHQADFCKKIIEEFRMETANSIKTPVPLNVRQQLASESPPFDLHLMQKAIGMLTYLALHTRPNIAFTVNLLSQHVNAPTVAQWQLVKHLLCYLCGTMSTGIKFTRNNSSVTNLVGWADADYGNSALTKKSTSGFVITLYGNPISWCMKKQPIVAQ